MNLRVVHLQRKVERIDRDIEELEALMGTLQMDREYSARLRDSLVEESFRLRQLKQRIHSQVIRIPPQFEAMIADGKRPEVTARVDEAAPKTEAAAKAEASQRAEPALKTDALPARATVSAAAAAQPSAPLDQKEQTPNRNAADSYGKTEQNGRPEKADAAKKKPPFLFRFE